MRRAAAALAFVLPAFAHGAELQLGHGLPPVSLKNLRGGMAVEYCPDNTCEVFRSSKARSSGVLKDFAVMFLYGVSDYVYLQEFQAQDLGALVGELSSKYGANCEQPEPRPKAACVASHLARRNSIAVLFVRYDEGSRNESKVKW